jgi:hypothetical protein
MPSRKPPVKYNSATSFLKLLRPYTSAQTPFLSLYLVEQAQLGFEATERDARLTGLIVLPVVLQGIQEGLRLV